LGEGGIEPPAAVAKDLRHLQAELAASELAALQRDEE
jgi:hypothetical protein